MRELLVDTDRSTIGNPRAQDLPLRALIAVRDNQGGRCYTTCCVWINEMTECLWGLQILIDASNGASDYGNKFGEPLIAGYTRTFGLRMPSGERREWIKPIMFRQAPPASCIGNCEADTLKLVKKIELLNGQMVQSIGW